MFWLVALAAGAACGVPSDDEPRRIGAERVPYDLLAPSSTTSTTTPLVAVEEVQVHLVENDQLVSVDRQVLAPSVLFRRMAALLQGVQAEEAASGVRTAIPNDTRLRGVRIDADAGVATIDLSSDLVGVGGQEQILAIAQLVFTATETPSVTGVLFQLDGRAIEVPRGDGTLTVEPLRRFHFAPLSGSVATPS